MSTRSIASILLPSLLLFSIAFASNTGGVNAQSGPAITATPTSVVDTYAVVGSGFPSGAKIKVIEVTCGPLPCAAGGGGLTLATVDANGRFSVTLKLSDIVPTDRNYRVIAAIPDERAGLATDPQVQVPLHSAATGSAPTPGAPATGNSSAPTDVLPFGAIILAALGLAAAGASVLGLAAVRRR